MMEQDITVAVLMYAVGDLISNNREEATDRLATLARFAQQLANVLLAACGSAASVAPTPTPIAVLGQQYLKAADKANKALDALDPRLGEDCKTLDPCKRDFAEYSKIENTFVTELRAIKVPAS